MCKPNYMMYVIATLIVITSISIYQPAIVKAETNSADIAKSKGVQQISKIKETKNPPLIRSRMAALTQLIVDGKITVEESAAIVRNTPKFYNALIDVKSHADPIESDSADDNLKSITIQWVNLLNDLHGQPDRFRSIEKSDTRQLYTLLVYTKNHIYTSSFMGVFRNLLQQMKKEEITGNQLLNNLGYNRYSEFIEILVTYNRLHIFLGTMPVESQINLLERYIGEIEDSRNMMSRTVVIADAFKMIKNAEVLQSVQKAIEARYTLYDAANDTKGKAIFGLLASIYGQEATISQQWFKNISKQYRLLANYEIPIKELFAQKDISCIQQYFFYEDKEGFQSFQYFKSQYQNKTGWKIFDKETFVVVKSPVIYGRRIEIYANKPNHVKAGCNQIKLLFDAKKMHPVISVHRGHSYQTFRTLKELSSKSLLVFLGSCEGYRESIKTFEKCPRLFAFISTRGVTDAYINEIIGQVLNNELLTCNTGVFNLNKYWQKLENNPRLRNDPDFSDFVDPIEGYGMRLRRTLTVLGIENATPKLQPT
ncbi:MAG: hypothetical protein ACYC0V_11330 [Armatimonadota bacterium]